MFDFLAGKAENIRVNFIKAHAIQKENSSKYPQCSFPSDFVEKKLRVGGGEYTTDATDTEYKSCLRKNGLEDDKKPTSKEIQKNKTLCYKWYGKECDNPNFNPE